MFHGMDEVEEAWEREERHFHLFYVAQSLSSQSNLHRKWIKTWFDTSTTYLIPIYLFLLNIGVLWQQFVL